VMSSQATSAGRDEAAIRQKMVETGAVDVIIDIRSNFFYTRTVPCQLWFFDRAKERDDQRNVQVLMLDARNIYRKVSRAIYDFSPEQQKNIAAIIWLYRGQTERFLKLIESYLDRAVTEGTATGAPLAGFAGDLGKLINLIEPFVTAKRVPDPLAENWKELSSVEATLGEDVKSFNKKVEVSATVWADTKRDNPGLNEGRKAVHPLAELCRDLTRQIDLVAKLIGRVIDAAVKDLNARDFDTWPGADISRARKTLETARAKAVDALHKPRYFIKQADWLQERFPDAKRRDVEGLVKLVRRDEIKSHDWSLTPGRYVGVAPEEVDETFDFEEALRSIHIDLKGLNEEASDLAACIARNFEELGA
jgi:type I restriction enzyme M protein